jgi:ABC-type oligopeptide transport system ATPase subunit
MVQSIKMKKTCTRCGIEKDESEIIKDKRNSDGLSNICKPCFQEHYIKPNYKKNKDAFCARNRQLYKRNKKRVMEVTGKYRRKNQAKISEYSRIQHGIERKELKNSYIKVVLKKAGFTDEQINRYPDLVETYKQIIKIKRLCKSQTSNS